MSAIHHSFAFFHFSRGIGKSHKRSNSPRSSRKACCKGIQSRNCRWSIRTPNKKNLEEMATALRLVKSFASEKELKLSIIRAKQTGEKCEQEFSWYHLLCGDRIYLTDGRVTSGIALQEPICRTYSQRFAACGEATEAYRSAMSELLAWRRTYSEASKMRAGMFEDKFAARVKLCAQGP